MRRCVRCRPLVGLLVVVVGIVRPIGRVGVGIPVVVAVVVEMVGL